MQNLGNDRNHLKKPLEYYIERILKGTYIREEDTEKKSSKSVEK
jgi:hypothetical protein